MKKLIYLVVLSLAIVACKSEKKEEKTEINEVAGYASFGELINLDQTLSSSDMLSKFQNLQEGDSIDVKFSSSINDVCSKKGCWMKLELGEEKETMVRFKDYGFFMPLNSKGKEVVVEGKAFVKVTPVEELRHYAEDAGKSKEEIAKITEPKMEFAFEAHGVLMKK